MAESPQNPQEQEQNAHEGESHIHAQMRGGRKLKNPAAHSSSGWGLWLFLLLAIVGGSFWYVQRTPALVEKLHLEPWLYKLNSLPEKIGIRHVAGTLLVDSEPDGAEVWMSGQLLGTTPLAQANPLDDGASQDVVIKRKGYREYKQSVQGGHDVHVDAHLEHAR
jgi:hypothetical protein